MIAPSTLLRSLGVWRAWKRGRPRPLSVTWFVNQACNLRCRGCFFFDHPQDDGETELGPHEALALVDRIADLGVPFLELVGGEPFLRPDLLDLGRRARERGLWCGVTTNGTRMDPELAREVRTVFRTVFVSVDGPTDSHEAVRGSGTYDRTLRGLDDLLAAGGPARVGVSTIIGPENVESLPAWGRELRRRGVHQWVLSSGLAPAPSPPVDRVRETVRQLVDLRRRDPGFVVQDEAFFRGLLGFYETGTRYGCHVDQLLHVSVSPSGATSACCMWPVPLGENLDEALAAHGSADRFAPVDACGGCARHDYGFTMELFGSSWPVLIGRGLRAAVTQG